MVHPPPPRSVMSVKAERGPTFLNRSAASVADADNPVHPDRAFLVLGDANPTGHRGRKCAPSPYRH